MTYQDRISEIQAEIKNLEAQNTNLLGVIKSCLRERDLNGKAKHQNERQFINSKLVGLHAEMQYLQKYGKDYQ